MPFAAAAAVSTHPTFLHRGFDLTLVVTTEPTPRYGFVITHDDGCLHASGPAFATAVAAERAARLFVDDALCAFEFATQALADA